MLYTGYVYRNADDNYDCTMNGWSRRFSRVHVTIGEEPLKEVEIDGVPIVQIVKHRTMNSLHVVSLIDVASKKWTMFGGNFLHVGDSRVSDHCRKLLGLDNMWGGFGAIAIHDRIEG